MTSRPTAAIVTVGTELVTGLSVDTNSAEVARALTRAGYTVAEAVSAGDDAALLGSILRRLLAAHAMVVTTGGLGPTLDDVTRDAASEATGHPLERDGAVAEVLSHIALRHEDPAAAEQVFRQALVLRGARVLPATTGTAPGQVLDGLPGTLALLPGPPAEMRPMLAALLGEDGAVSAPAVLGIAGMPEGDAWRIAEHALEGVDGVTLGVLAVIGDVKVVLYDDGAGPDGLADAARHVCDEFGASCYSAAGESLAEAVLAAARSRGLKLATAESCTGGMVASRLTDVPGASDTFVGGVVAYGYEVKTALLDVPPGMLAQYGAVSEEVARAMAEGAVTRLGAGAAVSVTGIAGPDGATPDKPLGLVWFGLAGPWGSAAEPRTFPGDRERVRLRATAAALDLLRRRLEPR